MKRALALLALGIVLGAIELIAEWRARRWPREQHRTYFTDCRRVPEE